VIRDAFAFLSIAAFLWVFSFYIPELIAAAN